MAAITALESLRYLGPHNKLFPFPKKKKIQGEPQLVQSGHGFTFGTEDQSGTIPGRTQEWTEEKQFPRRRGSQFQKKEEGQTD